LRVEENRADQPVLVGFPAAYVFDVSQTEGNPLPEFSERVSGNVGEYQGSTRTDEITPNIVKSVRRDEGIRGPEGSTPEANARIVKLTSWEIKYSIPISPKLLQ
jgi:hypothetical protein